jgi:phosphoglycolate phosphatase
MKYKLAIFDMDGTILNTLDDLTDALNHSLTVCGYPQRSREEVRRFLGNGIRRLTELGVPEGTDNAGTERVFNEFNEYYAVHCADKTAPYDGIIDCIRNLRNNGIVTAVVSNKTDYAVQILCEKYFPGLFDFAAGAREGVCKKPHPDLINAVLSRFSTERGNAVYIGDSEVDIMSAENAEMDCISVEWGFRTHEELVSAGASVIITNPCELTRMIITD